MKSKTLLILTLKEHEDGIWIRRLVQSLQATAKDHQVFLSSETDTDTPNTIVQESPSQQIFIRVQPVEEWLAQGWVVSLSPSFFENVMGIINRVSDAASPALFKATCAILGAAQLHQIPIVNGPITYSLCGNKWCHHILFQQARLESPKTMAYWNEEGDKANDSVGPKMEALAANGMQHGKIETDLLIKPNSGGFGAGIQRVKVPLEEPLPVFEDCITLVQDYHPPKDNQLYRIWFLLGKVQCAVVRSITDSDNEFINACSGACSIQKPPSAWLVSENVRTEVEDQLLPLLADAHCGSIEFLYTQDESNKRLYFDLNLLSTLPTRVSNTGGVWADDYDPWMELANAIWKVVAEKEENRANA
ncbi:unnamed protein product [Cylindrotheca closterium]|uniref:ATP-grasp domain-containing protein n=1 Tax=Cylindrotheca closterium TaxID=2856 RepID=A0AAD2FCJ6_9STRA|nr:unnamed protein product [Cylindrotheca closterium]